MKLSKLAKRLATRVSEAVGGHDVTPLVSNKAMAEYGRKLESGCIALRVVIVANPDLPPELGAMTLFVPVSKKHLKLEGNFDNALASVLRFISQASQYRAEMIGRVRERMETVA